MATPTLNTQGGALQPTDNGGQANGPAFGAPTQLNNFISTLPSVPNPTPPPPKTLTVVTPKVAQDDLATKQDTTNQVASAVTAQTQNKLAQATQPSVVPGTQPTNTNAQQPQQQTQTSTNTSGTSYTPPANATPVTLPNGVQAYYDNDTQQLTTTTGQQLQFNEQAGWIDPTTGLPPAPAGTTNSTTGVPATGDPTTDYLNTQLQKNQTLADQANATHQQQLQQLLNGSFPLTADQQAQVAGLQSQYTQLEALQKQANDNLASATTILGIRNGQQQYAPGLAATSINKVVSDGITKLATLDTQASSAVASLKQGFFNNDYTQINGAYKDLTDAIAAKDDTLNSMQENVQKQVALQTAKIQQQTAQLANQTAAITSIASSALQQSLKADGTIDLDALQSIADANGVDVNALYGAVQKEQQTETTAQQQDAKFASDQLQAKAQLAQTQATTAKTYQDIQTAKQASSGTGGTVGITGSSSVDATSPGYASDIVPGSGGLTQAAIDQAAVQFATTGKFPTGIGTGSTGAAGQKKTAIQNRAAELNAGGNLVTNAAQVKSLQSALTTQTNYLANTQRSVANAEAGFQQVISAFQGKVNTSQYPTINAAVNATKGELSPGDISAYRAGLTEVANEYQQVFSRGGTVTDAVRAQAEKITDGDLSIDDLSKVFNELQAQGQIVVNGSQNQVSTIQGQLNGILSGSAGNQSGASSSSGFTPRGSTAASDFVANTFKSLYPGQTEQQLMSNYSADLKDGEQLAFDNKTGAVVAATKSDISSGNYTPL